MNRIFLSFCAACVALASHAGGILANTNQNATFLRNPARDAAIAIDGVYNNPAGIVFLPEGFHLSLSWQAAFQKRQITSNNPLYEIGEGNNGTEKFFEGESNAPIIPSFQAAYVLNDKLALSAQFAVGGGGGKCEFENGLPMFEKMIGSTLQSAKATSYALTQQITGKQYFYGLQVGASYKLSDNISVFGGIRGVLANCSYTGTISNIKANGISASTYLNNVSQTAQEAASQYSAGAKQAQAAGQTELAAQYAIYAEQYQIAAESAKNGAKLLEKDLVLDCSQSDIGFTPIIGIDVNLGKLNLAAKYEFRTKLNLENDSKGNSANVNAYMPQYIDGGKVRSDIPALFTVGAQYSVLPTVRVAAGFHYYWDKDAKGTPIVEGDNTWEALLGAEWDINKKFMISAGLQRTQYGFKDSDMSDITFTTSSTALCIGGAYNINDKMRLNVGYMHSFYGNHCVEGAIAGMYDCYTRKNDVVGISFDISF